VSHFAIAKGFGWLQEWYWDPVWLKAWIILLLGWIYGKWSYR